jgi:hypothetical protein
VVLLRLELQQILGREPLFKTTLVRTKMQDVAFKNWLKATQAFGANAAFRTA